MKFATLALAIPLFAVTNIDDIFVLLGFFSDSRFTKQQVVVGQFTGIIALITVSLISALISMALPSEYVGLLGLAPIAIGLMKLRGSDHADTNMQSRKAGVSAIGNIVAVAAVTIANGGDNIGVYAPLFATRNASEITGIVTTFLAMTAVWCWLSYWLVSHETLGAPIRRYGYRALPIVLIAIGCLILYEAGTHKLLMSQ